MTDGRIYTVEDDIDELHIELGQARRRLDEIVRAPSEGRWTRDGIAWLDAVGNQEQRVRRLERQLAEAYAEKIAAAEGFAA